MENSVMVESMLKNVAIIKQEIVENVKKDKHLNKVLEGAYAELRHAFSSHFYKQYGEWDWDVRQHYIDLIRSLGCEWPISEDTVGYAFELHNFTPLEYDPARPFSLENLHPNIFLFERMRVRHNGCTEFVPAEHATKVALNLKIREAFEGLRYFNDTYRTDFGIDTPAKTWADQKLGERMDPTGEF
jgi:hypothetical protein